jgi:hypothetical protein
MCAAGGFFGAVRCAVAGADADGDPADDDPAGVTVAAGRAADGDGARGDEDSGAIAAAFSRGLAAPPCVAEHPQMTTAAPAIKTGSERTRKAHLAYSSDISPRI